MSQKAALPKPDKQWTLFLDRDGVINKRPTNDYVRSVSGFEFVDGVPEAIKLLSNIFGRIIIVTNQQGIGKGLMTAHDLNQIHTHMQDRLIAAGGRIDAIYTCPMLASATANCRKPSPRMADWAKSDFPEIVFEKSIMAGDTASDMQFGQVKGMVTVLISCKQENFNADFHFENLLAFANSL
jgi:D-glycero-D-manno-heptose 1,7-bisphosphate phosphatase